MTKLSLIKVLDDLSKVRDILLSCKTRDEAIKSALDIVLKRLHPQTAAIFLFSKDGHLVRAGIKGTDLNDKPIDNNWFPQESYKVGESFTGRVVLPATDDSRYGKPQWFDDLGNEHLNDKSKSEYLSKLGEIKFVIGVPLNSQNRTYGVLEVINKLNRNDQGLTSFGTEEIYWLAAIGANLATSISNLRRNSQIRMLTEIGNLLVETPVDKNSIFRSVCEEIANKLLNPNTSFKVCVIHGGVKPDPLRVLAKAKVEGVTWKGRKDGKREYGTGFVGRAADSGEHIIVKRISEDIDKFYNQKWIKDNHLDSCACLPLVAKGKVVGTISLFAGYNYTFHEDIINLLQSVASLIASFALRAMASEEVRKLEKHQK
ncbi:MAG: GAF domain-containing protein, partial [Pseudanabaenales cyanobacterium]|nr:GAF domain-containing protein [Pseudanabaenales cyanobacterium]